MDLPLTEIRAPTRGNRKLEALFEAANADRRLHAWWYMQQVNADRRDMSDHSWVHIQIVVNIALRLFRLLNRGGVEPAMVTTHGMNVRDAEVVIAAACLFHDTGMSIHRTDHEQYSLFLASDRMPLLLEGIYKEPELTVVISEALHAVIGHRRARRPDDDRGRHRARGRRARHGERPLADPVRDPPPEHPLGLGRRHRRRDDRAGRREGGRRSRSR